MINTISKWVMLTCALRAHDKVSQYRNYTFNIVGNLMLKSKYAQVSRNNFYICFLKMYHKGTS
jgi:hypothetical protein